MFLLIIAVSVIALGGVAALITRRSHTLSTAVGAGSSILGSVVGLISAVQCLISGGFDTLRFAWGVPFGSLSLGMDALSAFFLIPVFILCALSALYGSEYMSPYFTKRHVGAHWFFFNVLLAGMALVVTARDGLLFLVAWEVMSLAPFFLVTFDDDRESVRSAGWTYIVAAHLGAIPLLALFILLGQGAGSLSFDTLAGFASTSTVGAGTLFVLALVGFGTKAGFLPLHVWLPEAHPAAPSHVSAVMSGVMLKMGIYGIMRTLTFLGTPPAWWGYTLIGIGLASGIFGVLFAIAQHDLKRLLAYHSVENIGIISLGLGMGLLGQNMHSPLVTAMGYGGALLHVLNHALFKGLLFLGAGAVLHSAGTVEIERLGGLAKHMPRTALVFVVGAAAISGLPPLNGFISEFMIYIAGTNGGLSPDNPAAIVSWCTVVGLALIGGLAAACFAKAAGAVFLGEPRDSSVPDTHDPGPAMLAPMVVLAVLCLLIGLASPVILGLMTGVISGASGLSSGEAGGAISTPVGSLTMISILFGLLLALIGLLAWIRARLLSAREVGSEGTWDCGYASPTPRMQYTASSFAQPVTLLMGGLIGNRPHVEKPSGLFPRSASFESGIPGGPREYLYRPVFAWVSGFLSRFRWLQHGKIHLYVLYIVITLVAILLWKL